MDVAVDEAPPFALEHHRVERIPRPLRERAMEPAHGFVHGAAHESVVGRLNERRRDRNKAVRSELKTRVKSAIKAAGTTAEGADDALRLAIKRIDKAATKGVIHKNSAARRKSRLMRQVNAAASAEG